MLPISGCDLNTCIADAVLHGQYHNSGCGLNMNNSELAKLLKFSESPEALFEVEVKSVRVEVKKN